MQQAEIIVIINPTSGVNRRKQELVDRIQTGLAGSSEILFTKKKGDAGRFARNAVKAGCKAVVAVGGDGSINECATELVNTDVALGIIPAGSGNGLARCLKIPFNIENALKCISHFHTIQMDALMVNKRWAFSIAGFGLDARIAKLYEKEKKRGFYPYLRLTIQEYLDFEPIAFELKSGHRSISDKALFVSIANSNQFGYNTIIANNAVINDGLMDVCIFHKVPLMKIPVVAPFFFLHKLDYSGYMDTFQTNELTVVKRKGRYVNIDGEAVKMKKKLKVKLHHKVLKVIVDKQVASFR